ncbi:hypothetical protein PC129_g17347 [Phytophthora cactorum]|uniref:Uncharacterized protein n=1 Tax=Phytophthora cactorum TaxID=29920 RepID=A0A8T1G6Z6_9STRA|nr:hypothetical protein Pcac1_g4920 [Phytophthora cactorum]KAG2807420.1 hypothetical protein PC111_g16946 [Phytophthora cactorum]KAG2820074.1 hypothetical protein PC112_g11926 [Phytophthora cactorum]KAG2909795.1 hypothetical protein PC114_g9984 [Phytophthora cactorum]KAG2915379.1 hypothetical protein PC115_g11383 [Phytophthora cactorum]
MSNPEDHSFESNGDEFGRDNGVQLVDLRQNYELSPSIRESWTHKTSTPCVTGLHTSGYT